MLSGPSRCEEGTGWRNFACPVYSNCLDKAVRRDWSGFSCSRCIQKKEVRLDWCEAIRADQDGLRALAFMVLGVVLEPQPEGCY